MPYGGLNGSSRRAARKRAARTRVRVEEEAEVAKENEVPVPVPGPMILPIRVAMDVLEETPEREVASPPYVPESPTVRTLVPIVSPMAGPSTLTYPQHRYGTGSPGRRVVDYRIGTTTDMWGDRIDDGGFQGFDESPDSQ